MSDDPAGAAAAPATLKAGALHWLQVSALGIAIAISGNVAGWNYGLGVGGWGGMLLAALAMALLFWCLTQSLAELAAALPEAGGFDGYVRRALGPTAAYLTACRWRSRSPSGPVSPYPSARRMSRRGSASAVGRSSSHFWSSSWGRSCAAQARRSASRWPSALAALVILVAFCLYMAPEYQSARLFSVAAGRRTQPPSAWTGRSGRVHPVCAVPVSRRRAGRPCRRRNARHAPRHAEGARHGDRRRVRDRPVRAV